MSEMHEVEVMFKDQQVLVEALREAGLECEVFEHGTTIDTYYDNRERPKSHIVVRRDQFQGMRDIGFEKTANGFVMHADDYDYDRVGKKINLDKITQIYAEKKIIKDANQSCQFNVVSRTTENDGTVVLEVRNIS